MRRLGFVALMGALAIAWGTSSGCGGGPGGGNGACRGSQGMIQATFQGVTFPMTCFAGSYLTSRTNAPGSFAALGDAGSLTIGFFADGGCSFSTGQMFQMTDPCIGVEFEGTLDGGVVEGTNGPNGPPDPRQGSMTITSWSTTTDGTMGVSFSGAQEYGVLLGGGLQTLQLSGSGSGLVVAVP